MLVTDASMKLVITETKKSAVKESKESLMKVKSQERTFGSPANCGTHSIEKSM